jgi:hypothetical protein
LPNSVPKVPAMAPAAELTGDAEDLRTQHISALRVPAEAGAAA